MLYISRANSSNLVYLSYFGSAKNLIALFTGIFKNPGIPKRILERTLKIHLMDKEEHISGDDIE